MRKFRIEFLILIVVCVFCVSGCALLQIPGQLIGGIFGLIGKILDTAAKMPHPPPWMWGN